MVDFFNFAAFSILCKKIVAKFATFLYSLQNLQSSDICGILKFVAKLPM